MAYPSGFTAKYAYTTLGYLYTVSDNATGAVFWYAGARDAELHLLSQTQGNFVVTNQAFDPNTGLVQSILAGTANAVSNQTFAFDALGNLTARTLKVAIDVALVVLYMFRSANSMGLVPRTVALAP